jgi:SAM-dependent methyltransferase
LRCDGKATRRVLDIGCGHGGLLKKVRRQMGVEVLGVDLRPPEGGASEFPILKLAGASTAGRCGRECMPGSSPAR